MFILQKNFQKAILFTAAVLVWAALPLGATVPAWWSEYGVVDSGSDQTSDTVIGENYQLALLGQAKFMAYQAYLTMEAEEKGSAGSEIKALVEGFSTTTDDNYQILLLGQLKEIAKPFYDRFEQRGYDVTPWVVLNQSDSASADYYPYPWKDPQTYVGNDMDMNYQPANVGQLKYLFSFGLENWGIPSTLVLDAISDPIPGTPEIEIATGSIAISGVVTSTNFQSLSVNGVVIDSVTETSLASAVPPGSFSFNQPLPDEGLNELAVRLRDQTGNVVVETLSINRVTQAPVLTVNHPFFDPMYTNINLITVDGKVGDSTHSFEINGVDYLSALSAGNFSIDVSLSEGVNLLEFVVADVLGNTQTVTSKVILDTSPPAIDSPTASMATTTYTNSNTFSYSGKLSEAAQVFVNGVEAKLSDDGTNSFSEALPLIEGNNTITVDVIDNAGNAYSETFTIYYDTLAPDLVVISPNSGSVTNGASVSVQAECDDQSGLISVTVNGVDMSSGAQYFSATLPLEEGINDFVLVATDTAGNSTSRSVQVSRDTVAPSFVELSPADDESVTTAARTVSVTGQIDDHSGWVTINGGDPILPVNGLFTTKLALGQETNLFSVQAFDLAGNVSDAFNFTVIRQTVPGAIVLTNPPSYIQNDRVPFAGTATADSVVTVSGARNSIEAVADSSSNFATDEVIVFSDQSNYLVFTALDSLGNVSNVGHQLISDTVAPTITVLSPTEGADVNSGTVTVAGFINDANPGGTVSINGGTPVVANAEGFFTTTLDFVHGVSPTLAIQAMDEAGNVSASVDRSFSVSDAGGPAFVQILSPSYGETVPSANVDLTLIVQNRASLTEFSVNGTDHLASIVSDSVTISGVTANANNEILISYTSSSGNSSLTHLLDVDSSVPAVPVVQTLSPSGHVQSREVALFATMDPDTAYRIDGGLFSGDLIGRSDSTGQVSVVIPLVLNDVGSENVLSLTAIGANGLESQKLLPFVRHDTLAPALAEVDGILPPVGGVLTVAAPAVTLTFDSAMETPLESDFQFSQGGSVLPFSMTSSLDGSGNTQITITPTILLNGSDVLLSILGPLTDLAGNAFDGLLEYRFETIDQTAPDDPEIISYRAVTNESSVEVIGTAEAGSTVTISDGVASLATVVAGDDGSFVVNVPLATESTYNLIATASDNATQPNSSQEVPFNVERNDSAFQILSTVPVDGETNVDTAAPITVSMSRKLNPGTIDDIFLFRPNLGEIPTEVAFDGNEQVVTLTPQEPLQGGLEYTLRIPTSVRDDVGNYLQAQEEVTFTTAIGSLDAPFLYADVDETGALFVDIIGTTSPNLEVRSSSGEFVIADVNGDFSLRVALVPDAKNEFNITVTDGNIVSPASLFTAFQDSTPPTLERVISPRNPTANLVLAFDESLQDLPTIDLDNGITGVWSFADEHNQRIVFKPDADWQIGTIYNLSITAGLIDAKGNLSSQVESGSFTVNAIQSGPDLLAAPILDPLGFARTTSPFITLRGTARTGTSLFVLGGAAQASVDIPGDGTADARFSIQVPLVQDSLNELVAYVIESGGAPGLPATVSLTHLRRETGVRIISPSADLEYNSYSVMITGILDNPAEFTSVTMETDANGSSVTEDMALIGPYFAKQFILEPYDVTLQSGAITDSSGSRRLIVADVGGSLHFRFINKDGGIQDFDSSVDFADKVAEVAALKNELDSNAFWSKALSNSEKISIFNYAAMLADFTVDEGSVSVAVSGTLLDGTVKSDSVDFSVFIQPEGLDTRAPQVSFLYPDPESVDGEAEVIGVEVIETLIVVEEGVRLNSVDVNGVVAHQELGNFFLIYAMPEEPGLTTLRAEAEDYEGNLGFNEVEVFFDTEPPSDPYEVSVDLTLFSDRVITVSGKGEPGSIIVVENGLVPVQVQVPSDSVDGSWTIQVPINENTASTLEIYARDAAGNQTKSQSFPIVHDDTAPYVLSALPGDGDVGVSPNASLFIEFSEPMDPATDFQMELDLASRLRPSELLTFNALLSADGQTLEVIPHFTFDHGDTITVTLESGLPDANGLTSIAAYQYTFDTALFDTTLSGVVLDPQIQPLANIKVGTSSRINAPKLFVN
ncbi:MAG: Ig-like domain-containing protein [Verrucomicrobiota bacterium]